MHGHRPPFASQIPGNYRANAPRRAGNERNLGSGFGHGRRMGEQSRQRKPTATRGPR